MWLEAAAAMLALLELSPRQAEGWCFGAIWDRMMVAYVFPSFMFLVQMLKGVILFKRGKKFDVEVRDHPPPPCLEGAHL